MEYLSIFQADDKNTSLSGLGIFQDLNPHELDLLLYLIEDTIKNKIARMSKKRKNYFFKGAFPPIFSQTKDSFLYFSKYFFLLKWFYDKFHEAIKNLF